MLPQPLVQKSFTISKIPFFPQNFLATQTVEKNQENSGKFEANVSQTLREIEYRYIA
jgi:hypothetical protein